MDQAYQFLQTHQVVFDPQLFALLKERRVKASTASQPIFSTSYSQVKRFVDRLCQKHKLQISPHNFRHRLANQRFEELCDAAAVRWDITQPQELNEELRGTRLERRRLKAAGRQAGILGAAADFIDDSMDQAAKSYIDHTSPALERLLRNVQDVDRNGVRWEWRPDRLTYVKKDGPKEKV